jgi:Uncharacterised nucleotidyltransferase
MTIEVDVASSVGDDVAAQRLAEEMFLTAAGPALVKNVAEILGALRIPVMPLKGVLLQKLVYGGRSFRPIRDVDLLVPESRFLDACSALRAAGFSEEHWQAGRWQVTLRNPNGPPLGVDLHRLLTRTDRSGLTPSGLFERGRADTQIFGASVILPSGDDLFAHLLLHATLHWIRHGRLHHPRDFEAVARALSIDPGRCAEHLHRQRLVPHALAMLPIVHDHDHDGDRHDKPVKSFIEALLARLPITSRSKAASTIVKTITTRFEVGHPARRLAGLALAPSLRSALVNAARDRVRQG